MKALVSIIIPAYNAAKWLQETINSALGQTWYKKEIIIVDDGSTDDTYGIAQANESKAVKIVTQQNQGASAARNVGLKIAQGDYIQWLDADDLLAPDKISQQFHHSADNESSKVLLSSAFGKFYFRYQKAIFTSNALWQNLSPIDWMLIKFNHKCWMTPSSWLVGRRLTDLAGPWDERLSFDDDGEYFCRVVAASEGVKFIPTAKSYYRQSNINSLSRIRSNKACQSLFLSYNLCIKRLIALENSERSRAASIKLLQHWLYHFFPENPNIYPAKDEFLTSLLCQINNLARELGEPRLLPSLNWKHILLNKLIGWKMAMTARETLSSAKTVVGKTWDGLLHSIGL